MRDFQKPHRSAVYAANGMAATSHPLATSTAIDILRSGGNAVDAAIAASAVLSVVEPQMTGIGGDCFAIVARSGGHRYALNGSGRAPKAVTTDWFLERGIDKIDPNGPHSVTVPGAVKAWETLLADEGTRGLDTLIQPAISYAVNGFPVAPRVAEDWRGLEGLLKADEGARQHYLVNEQDAPDVGSTHRLPALAKTLKAIAAKGADGFYRGPIAEDIVSTLKSKGGLMELSDLAAVEANRVDLISTEYDGLSVAEIPPSGQGIVTLLMLNILSRFNLAGLDPDGPERYHLELEAARLAYAIRDLHVADPEHMHVSVETLLSDEYADRLAARIDPKKRAEDIHLPPLAGSDTVYLTVVDKDRTAISFINSVYAGFGSGIVTPHAGVVLQNRGACFVVKDGHPNTIGPAKRPLHTIIPAMAFHKGEAIMSFGVMGGAYQPVGQTHVLTNWRTYGMDPQAMIDHPRIFWNDDGSRLVAETSISESTVQRLSDLGHRVEWAAAPHGGGQAIQIDQENGVLIGGSDPRKDGLAMGY